MIAGTELVALTGVVSGAFACSAIAYAWVKWLYRPRPLAAPADQEARLRNMEQTLEAVALEVERIGESVRYTTRLLGERSAASVPMDHPPAPHRPVITPH